MTESSSSNATRNFWQENRPRGVYANASVTSKSLTSWPLIRKFKIRSLPLHIDDLAVFVCLCMCVCLRIFSFSCVFSTGRWISSRSLISREFRVYFPVKIGCFADIMAAVAAVLGTSKRRESMYCKNIIYFFQLFLLLLLG